MWVWVHVYVCGVSEGGGQEGYFFSAAIICIMDFLFLFCFR